jgi:hypothetical protein
VKSNLWFVILGRTRLRYDSKGESEPLLDA